MLILERVAQHHRHRKDGGERIGDALAGDIRRGAVDRFVEALAFFVERRRGQHADRAGEHRRLIRKNIAEQVAGDDHVELLRVTNQLHGAVVDVHVAQLDVEMFFSLVADDFPPELGGLEHIRLVYRAKLLGPLARRLEADARDAPDLGLAVAHGVEALPHPGLLMDPLRLAEVDVAGQLAHDQQVEPGNQLCAQRRRRGELRMDDRGAKVRE